MSSQEHYGEGGIFQIKRHVQTNRVVSVSDEIDAIKSKYTKRNPHIQETL